MRFKKNILGFDRRKILEPYTFCLSPPLYCHLLGKPTAFWLMSLASAKPFRNASYLGNRSEPKNIVLAAIARFFIKIRHLVSF